LMARRASRYCNALGENLLEKIFAEIPFKIRPPFLKQTTTDKQKCSSKSFLIWQKKRKNIFTFLK